MADDLPPLAGRSILVVENEPLIALDLVEGISAAGATVLAAHSLIDGLRLAGHPNLTAAVLNFDLGDGDGTALCEYLRERGIPFLLHTGFQEVDEACNSEAILSKPAPPSQLVSAIQNLIETKEMPPC